MLVDFKKRDQIKIYHSSTHLLHSALREILGKHVTQKGSLVSSDRLRFDFSHPSSINDNDINKIENLINKYIQQNDKINVSLMSYEEAVKKGAMALFGEKYDDEVRVVTMGKKNNESFFSMELCGGTHVKNTGEIVDLKIIKESSVSSGIRRIEALTGNDLFDYVDKEKKNILNQQKEKKEKEIKKNLDEKNKKDSLNDPKKNNIIKGKENSINYYFRTIHDFPPNDLPRVLDDIKKNYTSGIIVLFGVYKKNISIIVGVTKNLLSKINAIEIVKKLSKVLGGKGGGGRPDFARGGGNKVKNIPKSCKTVQI